MSSGLLLASLTSCLLTRRCPCAFDHRRRPPHQPYTRPVADTMLIVTQVAPYVDGPAGVHGVLGPGRHRPGRAGRPGRPLPRRGDRRPRPLARDLTSARVLALFTIGETPWSGRAEGRGPRAWRAGDLRILGVHSATDASHSWPEYGSMLGRPLRRPPLDPGLRHRRGRHRPPRHRPPRATWQLARRGLPLPRPAPRRPGAAPPGRRPGRPVGARGPGARLRLSPRLVRARTAPPAPSTAALGHFPGPGRRPAYLRHLAGGLAWLVASA